MNTISKELNVFRATQYGLKYSLKHPLHAIKGFFDSLKYAWQRATTGSCDIDTFDMRADSIRILYSQLERFIALVNSYPDDQFADFSDYDNALVSIRDNLVRYLNFVDNEDAENEYWEDYSQILSSTVRMTPDKSIKFVPLTEAQECVKEKYYSRKKELEAYYNDMLNKTIADFLQIRNNLWW